MKEYKLPILNDYYRDKLDLLIADDGNGDYFSEAQLRRFRPAYNRLRKNPVWQKIADRGNRWELMELAQHITKGEIIANAETFLWYLLDRYENHRQITIYQAAEDEECIRWNMYDLTCWLNGLSIKYSDLVHFTNTFGLGAISFQRTYKNQ